MKLTRLNLAMLTAGYSFDDYVSPACVLYYVPRGIDDQHLTR